MYNLARGVFLSSKVTVADSANEPLKMLKVLVGGLGLDAVSGLWLSPLYAAPAVPRLFPFDLLYLDRHNRVVAAVEVLPGVEFPPFRREVVSALLLAHQTLHATQTAQGDRLIIGLKEEVEREIGPTDALPTEPIALNGKSHSGEHLESKSGENGHAVSSESGRALFGEQVSAAATSVPENAVSATALESSVSPEVPEAAAKSSVDDAEGRTGAELPVISITEVVLERPPSQQAPSINGQHRGVEDLFSIWMDSPLSASGWIARNGAIEANGATSPSPASVLPLSPLPETASESKSSPEADEPVEATQQSVGGVTPGEQIPDAPPERKLKSPEERKPESPARRWDIASAVHSETAKNGLGAGSKPKPAHANGWAPAPASAEFSGSTRIAQLPLATTFTIGKYGLWQASMPLAERPAASAGRTEADTGSAMTEAKESKTLAEDLEVSANVPLLSSVAVSSQENEPEPGLAAVEKVSMQPLVSVKKAAVAVPGKTETPIVAAADTNGIAHIEEAVQKNPAEPNAIVDFGAAAPAKTAASKQPVDKKKPASFPPTRRSFPQPSSVNGSTEQESKPKVSTQQPNANGKAKEQPLSLGMRFKRWLNPVAPTSSDRRKAYRRYVPGMVAHYYTGGAPKPHDVADISMTGIYLLTDDRWMPETMIQMTLQKPCAKGERKQSIAVLAKIVRRGSDGVAAQFVMPESLDPHSHDVQPAQATDRFSLARFI